MSDHNRIDPAPLTLLFVSTGRPFSKKMSYEDYDDLIKGHIFRLYKLGMTEDEIIHELNAKENIALTSIVRIMRSMRLWENRASLADGLKAIKKKYAK